MLSYHPNTYHDPNPYFQTMQPPSFHYKAMNPFLAYLDSLTRMEEIKEETSLPPFPFLSNFPEYFFPDNYRNPESYINHLPPPTFIPTTPLKEGNTTLKKFTPTLF
jgi:hypothetical protein